MGLGRLCPEWYRKGIHELIETAINDPVGIYRNKYVLITGVHRSSLTVDVGDFDSFWSINEKLIMSTNTGGLRSIPLRLYVGSAPRVIQEPVPPYQPSNDDTKSMSSKYIPREPALTNRNRSTTDYGPSVACYTSGVVSDRTCRCLCSTRHSWSRCRHGHPAHRAHVLRSIPRWIPSHLISHDALNGICT